MRQDNIKLDGKTILITGVAGFIGSHLAKRILSDFKHSKVIGLDNLSDYYDVRLKRTRIGNIEVLRKDFTFIESDISDFMSLEGIFANNNVDIVVNLAAQAGVRYSLTNPSSYIQNNIVGFFNILECCRKYRVDHLVYASSSSVYGDNLVVPFSTDEKTDSPVSLYAATKKSNELMAYTYSKLFDIPATGLRFFTVYGEFGRPDMAYFKFADKWTSGEKIEVYNEGKCFRDFTYIDDIVEGIIRVVKCAPEKKDPCVVRHKVYNIGNGSPVTLIKFIQTLRDELVFAGVLEPDFDLNKCMNLVPMQDGDVVGTYADTKPLETDFGYKPSTSIQNGLRKFAEWYKEYVIQHN